MTYYTAEFIAPNPRCPGWHDVHAKVTWTPRGGEPVTIEGDYLDASNPNGRIFLGCGIEDIAEDLGLWDVIEDHIDAIVQVVDVQLAQHSADLTITEFPSGSALVNIHRRSSVHSTRCPSSVSR
jgi:hypothetical protein